MSTWVGTDPWVGTDSWSTAHGGMTFGFFLPDGRLAPVRLADGRVAALHLGNGLRIGRNGSTPGTFTSTFEGTF